MLPGIHRLTRTKDYDVLYQEGRFVSGQLINLSVWRVVPEKYPRRGYGRDDLKIGVVVGAKVSRRAVERNRLKRQMREVLLLLLKEKQLPKGFYLAFIAKPGMVGQTYPDIENDMMKLLRRAGLLSPARARGQE